MESQLPILIFKGDTKLCYGILYSFSLQLKEAMVALGEDVIFFDPSKDRITECFGKSYKAVIGFMETFFYNTLPDSDTRLFDLILGPKFNYWPDHPAFYYQYMDKFPKDYHILTLDRNYVKYINTYYKNTKAFFLPPGGIVQNTVPDFEGREYGISFLGTYVDYRDVLGSFDSGDEVTKIITRTYLDYMIANPNETTEDAFSSVLKLLGANVTTTQYLTELCKIHRIATMGAARYYKEKVVETIVNSGIVLNVFGDSWAKSPFAGRDNLRIHPEIPAERVFEVYQKSRISLNIMTWHKDSVTERVLDAMLSGSIVLTDRTKALAESFEDKKDILYFDPDKPDRIPELIRENVDNSELAENGYKKALSGHTWRNRAEELLKIIGEEVG